MKKVTENRQTLPKSTQSSAIPHSKASEKLKHSIPPPGHTRKVEQHNVSYHPKIRKNERNIQEGGGGAGWIKNGTKNFDIGEEIDTYLQKIYYDIRSPVAYSSFSKLHPYVKKKQSIM